MAGVAPGSASETDAMGALLDQYLVTNKCQHGDIVEGVIASVTPTTILIDIGGKCDAAVHPREVERMLDKDLNALKPGQPVSVYVLDPNDDEGTMVVSLARAAQQNDWDRARALLKSKEPVQLVVIDVNKGGAIVKLGRLRGFVPGSQLLPHWRPGSDPDLPDQRWQCLMDRTLTVCVIEVTPERNRLIFSEREACPSSDPRAGALGSLTVGTIAAGVVSNIVPFGAFVNLNGMDGLLHISELSWKRVNHPREVVQVGQTLDVYILDVDLAQGRLALSLKRLTPDPWAGVAQRYREGQLVEVDIVNLTSFGAFAALVDQPELEGLIHISELSHSMVQNAADVVKVGERHTVKLISLKPDDRRLAFSLKQARAATQAATLPTVEKAIDDDVAFADASAEAHTDGASADTDD